MFLEVLSDSNVQPAARVEDDCSGVEERSGQSTESARTSEGPLGQPAGASVTGREIKLTENPSALQ